MQMLGAIIAARISGPPSPLVQALDPEDQSPAAIRLRASGFSYRDWFMASTQRSGIRARWQALFKSFDVVICPITPTPAVVHDHSEDQGGRKILVNGAPRPYGDMVHWVGLASFAGLPATGVPIARSPEGLPIGAQIIGPWLEDRTCLGLARLIEREFGGFSPPPAFA